MSDDVFESGLRAVAESIQQGRTGGSTEESLREIAAALKKSSGTSTGQGHGGGAAAEFAVVAMEMARERTKAQAPSLGSAAAPDRPLSPEHLKAQGALRAMSLNTTPPPLPPLDIKVPEHQIPDLSKLNREPPPLSSRMPGTHMVDLGLQGPKAPPGLPPGAPPGGVGGGGAGAGGGAGGGGVAEGALMAAGKEAAKLFAGVKAIEFANDMAKGQGTPGIESNLGSWMQIQKQGEEFRSSFAVRWGFVGGMLDPEKYIGWFARAMDDVDGGANHGITHPEDHFTNHGPGLAAGIREKLAEHPAEHFTDAWTTFTKGGGKDF